MPRGAEFDARLSSVLQVIYLVFNEGYSATAGDDWLRPALCEDALRLGRILAELVPKEAEVHGLVALMEIQASRSNARVGPSGEPVLLLDQDRARWDYVLINRGLTALARAEALGGDRRPVHIASRDRRLPRTRAHRRRRPIGRASRRSTTSLRSVVPTPVVELNRAVAVSMALGPAAGLEFVDALSDNAALKSLPPAAERTRRPIGQAWPSSRSARRVRTRRVVDQERARTGAPHRPELRRLLAPSHSRRSVAFFVRRE